MTHFGGIKSASLSHEEAILAGIDEHGCWALVHASEELRRDADFLLRAVAKDGGCLRYAADELCADEKAAVSQNGHAMRFAAPSVRAERHFALECVKSNSEAMLYVSTELRDDAHFTLEAALSGCSKDLVNPRLRVWLEKRDELLVRMRETIDNQDLPGIREVIKDGEEHGLPDKDLQEPRSAVKKLVKYSEVGSLWEPLQSSDGEPPVVLIRGSWLCSLAASGGRLPRRQELPAEAVWDCRDLQADSEEYDRGRHQLATKVVAVSHSLQHPDPSGVQLRAVANLARSCLQDLGDVDIALFIDYCSLFQEPRTPSEEEVFEESLKHVALWYAHKRTQVWVLTATASSELPDATPVPYEQRGWPSFERNVAELLACEGGAGQSILLVSEAAMELLEREIEWPEVMRTLKAKQEPPKVPSAFCDLLATKSFSEQKDLKMLQDAYSVVFEETMNTMRNLVYCDLGWGDRAAADLALAVKACFLLVNINQGNSVADDGCGVLFEAFTQCVSLAQITLRANRVGDIGARHIAMRLPQCLSVEELDLSFNRIGNAGAEEFLHMFQNGPHPSMKELLLNNNLVGSSLKLQLASVAQECQGSDFTLRVL
ncbi:unnamed protein product [Effrenium voratum]|uniref:DUF4116 domain-containing protein n=1 Tax=Effrenium voratum TaxID=2562239 RepID=A0AA36NK12_9DINO|nr:unnamed protein product [Effrenium voratum]